MWVSGCKNNRFWQIFTFNLGKKEKRKGKIKAQGKNSIPVQEAATSSSSGFDREDFEEEKEFYETVCHWVNCDKGDFGTQDNLVKVFIILILNWRSDNVGMYFIKSSIFQNTTKKFDRFLPWKVV